MASRPQKFPAFPDFMEEVCFSWNRPASGPIVLNQGATLASLEGMEKLDLVGFPPVDSTIAALPVGGLARDPNPQCRVTETHLKRAYAAEAQATRLSNMMSKAKSKLGLDSEISDTPSALTEGPHESVGPAVAVSMAAVVSELEKLCAALTANLMDKFQN
ncbi:UNVERIFIED_CONTAM: hypothetical protein FKN15_037193 [Acipenser sinensis]